MDGFLRRTSGLAFLCALIIITLAPRTTAAIEHDLPDGWLSTDYLMWWTRGADLPPLVSTSPSVVPRPQAGVIGAPTTRILFGDEGIGDALRSGIRIDAGLWLDTAQTHGLTFDFLGLETNSELFRGSSNGDPILARPFFDAATGQQAAELVAFPGFVRGDIQVEARSPGLWGWGIGSRRCLSCCRGYYVDFSTRTDWLIGYRHLRVDDGVRVYEELSSPLFLLGTTLAIEDRFSSQNSFHGIELGIVRTERYRRLELEYGTRVALGWNHSSVRIRGETTITSPGLPTSVSEGGFLALSSNSGRYDNTNFGAVLQIGTNLVYHVTSQLGLRIGYTFIYWPGLYRAGDQIDTTINPNLLPPPLLPLVGPRRPAARLTDSDFWAQGLNLGLEIRF